MHRRIFPAGKVYSLRERRHSWGMECVPMPLGEAHVEKACPERPIPRGLQPACSPRSVGVSSRVTPATSKLASIVPDTTVFIPFRKVSIPRRAGWLYTERP